MVLPMNQQPRRNTSSSHRPSETFSEASPFSSLSCGGREVMVEICTPGARPPLHFVEGFATSHRGRSPSSTARTTSNSRGFASPTLLNPRLVPAPAVPTSSNPYAKHQRRTSTSIDGVDLTLMGVAKALKATQMDRAAVARSLREAGVDLRTRNSRGMTPLHVSCASGQVDVAKVLLMAGADAHARDRRSRCPLHMAASRSNPELVSALLACGADPNKASILGTTALHNAALLGSIDVSRALLLAGADPNSTDHNSFSPLYLASQNGQAQIVLDLLAAGADPGIKTNKGFTPLHVAARCGCLEVLQVLLDAGEDVDSLSSPVETTPLHLSAGFSRLSCVQELLKRGADPLKENKRGKTPLEMVGTLVVPVSADLYSPSKTCSKEASEKKRAGERVKDALAMAQRWQRRRSLVLVREHLRNRDTGSVGGSASSRAVGEIRVCEERLRRCDSSKRCRMRSLESRAMIGSQPGAQGQEWLLVQLCTHPDPVLMMMVTRFL